MSLKTSIRDRLDRISFQKKITFFSIILGVLPIATIGTYNYIQSVNISSQSITKDQKVRAQSIADRIDRFMFERVGDMKIVSSLPMLTTAKVSKETLLADKAALLNQFVGIYQVYDSIAAFDLNGNVIVQSDGTKIGNHANRDYFQEVLKTGKVVIPAPGKSKVTGKFVIHIAAPIKDAQTQQLIGVVRATIPYDRINEQLAGYKEKDLGYQVFDKTSGKIFLSSDPNRVDTPEDTAFTAARTQGGISKHTKSQQVELVSAAPANKVAGMPELPWTSFSTINESTASAESNKLLLTILIETLAMTGLTIGLSLLLSQKITQFIRQVAESITKSSAQIAAEVESQSQTVNNQANSALMTTGTVNQLGEISAQSAAQAEFSAQGAQIALSLAAEGTQAVQQSMEGMSVLEYKVNDIANRVNQLGEQTRQISTIAALVGDLANQTNMLALKAAVEASHAGEQGKGFSVVAAEIRKLADRSKKSAQRIDILATDIQSAIDITVMSTAEGTRTVAAGVHLAETTSAKFVGVSAAIDNVFVSSQQISNSAKQQAVAIQEVLNNMRSIAMESQESAVGIHRVKSSAEELTQIAGELKAVMS
jgi:methyl-accepting chemotaxis protein